MIADVIKVRSMGLKSFNSQGIRWKSYAFAKSYKFFVVSINTDCNVIVYRYKFLQFRKVTEASRKYISNIWVFSCI
jgi:hypothetical protein